MEHEALLTHPRQPKTNTCFKPTESNP